jgi:hypothetical protein
MAILRYSPANSTMKQVEYSPSGDDDLTTIMESLLYLHRKIDRILELLNDEEEAEEDDGPDA